MNPSTIPLSICAHCQSIVQSSKLNERQRSQLLLASAHTTATTSSYNTDHPASTTALPLPDTLVNTALSPVDPKIKEDIVRLILQYLYDEGYHNARLVLQDEANVKWRDTQEQQLDHRRMRKAILDGDWAELEKLTANTGASWVSGSSSAQLAVHSGSPSQNHKQFLYAIYRQQYLEYIEHQETQKAFTFMNKRLKPLEAFAPTPTEFRDLCYLLTCKSITDVPSFRGWEGIAVARERLADQFQNMLQSESGSSNEDGASVYVPPQRLLQLLRQATAYQIESSRYHPLYSPRVETLLHDYQSFIIPNDCKWTMTGHRGNIKCVEWVGEEGQWIASGSSDNTVRLWDYTTGSSLGVLEGHQSRIWDLSSNRLGTVLASGSGDGSVRLWDLRNKSKFVCTSTLTGHHGDVYSVKFHPGEEHVVSGGYDKTVRLYDLSREAVVKTFSGHQLSVSTVLLNPIGNLILSGSKDNSIRFWDVTSGLCVKTIGSHLGEVTSVEMSPNGRYLLSSSKDNSIRLWDVRMVRPVRRFKGHQNTSKNFLRAGFAGNHLIVSGSEDGMVHIWDREKGDILQRLSGHKDTVYTAVWNPKQAMLVSCSDDRTVKSWWFDEQKPLYRLDEEWNEMERDRLRAQEQQEHLGH